MVHSFVATKIFEFRTTYMILHTTRLYYLDISILQEGRGREILTILSGFGSPPGRRQVTARNRLLLLCVSWFILGISFTGEQE